MSVYKNENMRKKLFSNNFLLVFTDFLKIFDNEKRKREVEFKSNIKVKYFEKSSKTCTTRKNFLNKNFLGPIFQKDLSDNVLDKYLIKNKTSK